jgi:hypothetical protein
MNLIQKISIVPLVITTLLTILEMGRAHVVHMWTWAAIALAIALVTLLAETPKSQRNTK